MSKEQRQKELNYGWGGAEKEERLQISEDLDLPSSRRTDGHSSEPPGWSNYCRRAFLWANRALCGESDVLIWLAGCYDGLQLVFRDWRELLGY